MTTKATHMIRYLYIEISPLFYNVFPVVLIFSEEECFNFTFFFLAYITLKSSLDNNI